MKNIAYASYSLARAAGDRLSRGRFARLLALLDLILIWIERHRSRRQLMKLEPRLLHDIGITRADAEREYEKPFWRP